MDRAREIVKQQMEIGANSSKEEEALNNLKPEINNFLWVRLPKHVTMDQAEALAHVIFEMCTDPDTFFDKKV